MAIRTRRTVSRRLLTFSAFSVLIVLPLYFLLRAQRFFVQHAGNTVAQDQIAFAYTNIHFETRTRYIPRIIHQIFHTRHDSQNETVPAIWDRARHSCITLHQDWEYKVKSRDFIEKNYPWFLTKYDGFTFPVQRIDGCRANLEPLLYYPAWLTDGGRGSLSNNILGAKPNHPFWVFVTESLLRPSWNYHLPYFTISFETGQWFLTDVWRRYHGGLSNTEPVLDRVMMGSRPGSAPWIFFMRAGGSWWSLDSAWFLWIGAHLFAFSFGVVVFLGVILARLYRGPRLARVVVACRMTYQRIYIDKDAVG
ncbi:mannosyl phosphorylinositol ceramide synthase protein [Pochonia chlamydosporia 170]|uniref:Mannosyl phosphorylinositol ceramide synthase protein n=1 Tax=Pochonia chlamydosporia 170 TaxID=1380566 RepID=A0A179FN89_METCM|nr:mannosyl phosphorylinositol ceramide synthase protein [Pochonia chlamydosporia 170]OAQ66807.2 mannosyl phosphorylinositol ceramide synthase protein [Pochonia chlamydosporia 170]